ncbi:hypothetical protein [Pendulispora albinea]|uniref:DMP19 family protein n=1 Tax=Pendulispora albinea TaxID=2741071 RepID=A0ABZ2M0J0_9BACT
MSIPGTLLVIAIAGLGAWFLRRRRRRTDGDEEIDLAEFFDAPALVRERGHTSVWDYLRANPGVPMNELAKVLDGPPAMMLAQYAIQDALKRREMPELIRDFVLRNIHDEMRNQLRDRKDIFTGEARAKIPDGQPFAFHHHVTYGMPNPYWRVEAKMWEMLGSTPPPRDWRPITPDDPLLRSVFEQAVAALSEHDRMLFERGEIGRNPGDLYQAAVRRYEVDIHHGPRSFLSDLAKAPPELRHVLAAHGCQIEVRKIGLDGVFWGSTGVVVPEAAAGLVAVGMPRAAALVRKAMSILGTSYPRRRWWRIVALVRARERAAEIKALSYELIRELKKEAGGFEVAADAYVSAHTERATELAQRSGREPS